MNKSTRLFLFIAWTVFVTIALTYPRVPSPPSDIIGIDKIAHFILFFVFSVLFLRLDLGKRNHQKHIFLKYFAITIPILGEVIQIPVPGRQFCFFDIVANFTGFAVVFFFYHKKRYQTLFSYIKRMLSIGNSESS